MKAVIQDRYGSPNVLKIREIERPPLARDQILVKVYAASINGTDVENLTGRPLYARIGGLYRPRHPIPGSDFAGRVEAVGSTVTKFNVGDDVFGELVGYRGAFAEYVCASERTTALKPASMSFQEAASIPQAGAIAYHGICKVGSLRPGNTVLITGGGGGAGSFAIQLAKLEGAEVVGVDNSAKLEFMRLLGADRVMDYTRDELTGIKTKFDHYLDLAGHQSIFSVKNVLNAGGDYFFVGGSIAVLLQVLVFGSILGVRSGQNFRLLSIPQKSKNFAPLIDLYLREKLSIKIDKCYPVNQVSDAFQYLSEGSAKGKVTLTMTDFRKT